MEHMRRRTTGSIQGLARRLAVPRWLARRCTLRALSDPMSADDGGGSHRLRAALVTAEMATDVRLRRLRNSGYSAAVLMLSRGDELAASADRQAVERIARAGLEPYYWIEVGRCPELADTHPRWMASLQGHPEWRRFHKEFPNPTDDEVVKAYPWTPVFYREAFDAHLARIQHLLATRPATKGIFLNDLQGALLPAAAAIQSVAGPPITDGL